MNNKYIIVNRKCQYLGNEGSWIDDKYDSRVLLFCSVEEAYLYHQGVRLGYDRVIEFE